MGSLSILHWLVVLIVVGVILGVLVWALSKLARGASTEQRLQELAALKSAGKITDAEYAEQRARIIRSV
ncbi:MAG TPA: hypothetical protein VFB32_02620 [Rudaea sp.]|nr:hypothetical protein [Rudaea sp.]